MFHTPFRSNAKSKKSRNEGLYQLLICVFAKENMITYQNEVQSLAGYHSSLP